MEEAERKYHEIASEFSNSVKSNLFGKPCYKINGKPFVCFFENCMVFKLSGDVHQEALSLDGSCLFDPAKKNRPMKEWVQVPAHYSEKWYKFAESAYNYLLSLTP
jgi:hypothetical protein